MSLTRLPVAWTPQAAAFPVRPSRHLSAARSSPRASATPRRARRRHRPLASMKVAVVGCAHGELDIIYAAVREAERARGIAVDLVLCAGDFQAVRNAADLQCMACPPRFRDMRTFWKYYAGSSVAPVPTVFVGGNHEASNHLQEIPWGGLVAPNMYFLGHAGVVTYRGLRIGGVSGVYTEHNYEKERVERPPYPKSQIKSVYHTRKEDVDRLLRLRRPVDVFMSHDWPTGIAHSGRLEDLLAAKPFLKSEIANGSLGNPGAKQLLDQLQPPFWFSAHMHVKFPALVKHASGKETRFLALDKALPKRDFVQILDIPTPASNTNAANIFENGRAHENPAGKSEFPIELDAEWLSILRTEGLESGRSEPVSDEEMKETCSALEVGGIKPFVLPASDFERRGEVYDPQAKQIAPPSGVIMQPETLKLMIALGVSPESWGAPAKPASETAAEPVAELAAEPSLVPDIAKTAL